MHYRREIDGLRALAILPVLCFHAGLAGFGGGFVGVDVFFVVSGYLIASLIAGELEQGRFTLLDFYERRARRILPALFLMLLVCVPIAWRWLLPDDLARFSQSLAAVPLLVANLVFWRDSGYFDGAAELKPLLHTWSLAVEEQFYLLFAPLFLLLWRRIGRGRGLAALIALCACAGLAAAQWGATHKPAATFYLLPTRAWELLLGAALASVGADAMRASVPRALRETGAWLGLALIAAAVALFDRNTPMPGLPALLPVGGTALILATAHGDTCVARLLGSRALVGIGLISYSAYLWHQPLFAFARHRSPGELAPSLLVLLIGASLLLAGFSWRFVERPFRDRSVVGRRALLAWLGGAGLAIVALGMVGVLGRGFPSRLPPNLEWQSLGDRLREGGTVCAPRALPDYRGVMSCDFGDLTAQRTLMLYGDSHALALTGELDRALRARHVRGLHVFLDGCQTVPTLREVRSVAWRHGDCRDSFAALLRYVAHRQADLVVAARWTFRLYPIAGEIEDMPSRNSEGGVENGPHSAYVALGADGPSFATDAKRRALDDMLDGLLSTGRKVYLVYPVPEIAWSIARLNFDYHREHGQVLDSISIPHADYVRRHRFVMAAFDARLGSPGLVAIRPEAVFCNTFVKDRCVAQHHGEPLYFDSDHLSDRGARLVVDALMARFDAAASAR